MIFLIKLCFFEWILKKLLSCFNVIIIVIFEVNLVMIGDGIKEVKFFKCKIFVKSKKIFVKKVVNKIFCMLCIVVIDIKIVVIVFVGFEIW